MAGRMVGGGKREEEKSLWLRRVPITTVTDLYLRQIIKKLVNSLKWSSRENKEDVEKGGSRPDMGIDIIGS